MSGQLDMFRSGHDVHDARRGARSGSRALHATETEDSWVRRLEETGRYRVLRKLVPRPIIERASSPLPRVGIIVDTETTGLDHTKDEIIEMGMVAFTYDDEGHIGDVIGTFSALRHPYSPIPSAITKITGITGEMVAGKTISIDEVELFIADVDLIIAHNAKFDRPFCEYLAPGFANKAWACSVSEIDWASRGFEGTKLGYLIGQCGYFHDGHRAADDCHALLQILIEPGKIGKKTGFSELLEAAQKERVRIWAENSPFDMKEKLKARGYRWSGGNDGQPKAWWTEVDDAELSDELRFLQIEIYQSSDVEPLTKNLTALDRFKA